MRANDWLAKLDLSDAYLTVPLHPSHRRFVQFTWRGKTFQFTCLPFGLSSAPRIFTKLLKPIVSFLRKRGIRLVIYLDDILIMNSCPEGLARDVALVRSTLEEVGFLINDKKSETDPTQRLEFLGLMLDTTHLTLALTEAKKEALVRTCKKLLASRDVALWDLASLLGNFNWATAAIPFAQANLRSIQNLYISRTKSAGGNLGVKITLSDEAREDLDWWISRLDQSMGKSFLTSDPDLVLFSDASMTGWGATDSNCSTGGKWSSYDVGRHINELELLAAFLALQYFANSSRNCSIRLNIDNTTAVAHINKSGGTRSPQLLEIALKIAKWSERRNIMLDAKYLPGALNIVADMESRRSFQDCGDWHLNRMIFQKM